MIKLQHIEYLWGLAAIPVLLLVFLLMLRWKKRAMKRFAEAGLYNTLAPAASKAKYWIKFLFFIIAYCFLIIGIANPQLGSKSEEIKREGVDLIIALDVSNSMKAEDLAPNRLEAAKQAISKLIDNLKGDRLGVIVFGGEAYVQLPVTTDYSAAKLFLNTIDTDIVPTQGTNIGAAIQLAMKSFDPANEKNKALIIITDGEDHEEDAIKLAKEATEQGVSIHAIGMGSVNGAPIPVYQNGRITGYKKDQQGNTVVTKLNESNLKQIATAGKGSYVRATNSQAGLSTIFREINKMEKSEFGSKVFKSYVDYFYYFLAIALFLLLLEMMIPEGKTKWWHQLKLFS